MKKWVGLALTLAAVVAALAAPWLTAYDPLLADFVASLKPPGTPGHPLATHQLGRDLRSLVLHGARLLFRQVLPNVAPSIIVVASLQFSQFIVAEAAISFLGFGVQPPTPAWGSMLSESRDFLYVAWWLAAFPGAALALTALGVNLVGDWLRDTLDPKLRV